MNTPDDYVAGYERARLIDSVLAEKYVEGTLEGDPPVDAALDVLDGYPAALRHEWIRKGIEGGPKAIADAPQAVRELFASMEEPPGWWNPVSAVVGCRAFHRHSQMFLGAFVGGVLIEGFSTLISKSFSITGRVVDQGVKRLKQNNRHLVEIFIPGGLERQGDGWKLSVRIRLVHGQVRRLLKASPEWETERWGVPLCASHIAYASAVFSALLLRRASALGVQLEQEERESFMNVWRYSAHLMGVPDGLLFANEHDALALHRIGTMCEPPPSIEACQMANGLINSAPVVVGIDDPEARRALTRKIYRISRALIGNSLADALRYPPSSTFGVLPMIRLGNQLDMALQKWWPAVGRRRQASQFFQLVELSHYDAQGLSYRMPGQLHAEKDRGYK